MAESNMGIAESEDEQFPQTSPFEWNPKRSEVALALAEGRTQKDVGEEHGITPRTIRNWLAHPEFSAEVDRLTMMVSVAVRTERLRIAMRVVRQKVKGDVIDTDKDLLDWLKYAQGETDGVRLDLTALLEAQTSVADSGSGRVPPEGESAPRSAAAE